MESFDSIHFEVYISDAWVDLTPDVLISPRPRWNVGIMNNGPLDRTGDAERMTFYLRNGESCSGGLGYYSPGHANVLTGWTTGLRVRLYFVYEGKTYYKFHGRITPNGINVEPGLKGRRAVRVTAHGFMAQAAAHELRLMTLQENLRIDEAVPYVIANMPIAPLATDYNTGQDTFPTVFDTVRDRTAAIGELNKLALSEFGYIYTKGDRTGGETLVVEGRNTRSNVANTSIPKSQSESGFLLKAGSATDYILMAGSSDKIIPCLVQTATFDNIMMNGTQISYGKHLANRVKGVSYPRKVDAAATTVLFTLQKAIEIKAGQTKTNIRGTYRDPDGAATRVNGRDMVTPDAGTDYKANASADGTGADMTSSCTVTATYGTEGVEYSITNSASSSLYIGGDTAGAFLQARGKGIYFYDPVTQIWEDTDSQATHGVHPLSFDMKYQPDPLKVESFARYTLEQEKDPTHSVDRVPIFANRNGTTMYGFLALEPGARAHFTEDLTGVDGDYFIMGYSAEIISGKYVLWTPVLRSASGLTFWVLGTSALGTDTALGFPA